MTRDQVLSDVIVVIIVEMMHQKRSCSVSIFHLKPNIFPAKVAWPRLRTCVSEKNQNVLTICHYVELSGLGPLTSTVPRWRSTN